MKTQVWLQVKPDFGRYPYPKDHPRPASLTVARMTARRPRKPLSGTVVVHLTLDIADDAFRPLEPQVEVVIPATHTQAVQVVTSEPVEVPQ